MKTVDEQDRLDGIIGRFIHASDKARDAFIQEIKAEIAKRQRPPPADESHS